MKYFPLFHRLENQTCLIVGGGKVAWRRAKALVAAGANIHLISIEVLPQLEQLLTNGVEASGLNLTLQKQALDISKLKTDYLCIVAATNDRTVNKALHQFAKQEGIPVNVADNQNACDFIFPSIIDREPLTLAVSNNGASPVLSRLLKQQMDAYIPAKYGQLASFVGHYRQRVKAEIKDEKTRKAFWDHVLQGAIAEAVYADHLDQARTLFEQALQAPEVFNRQGEVYVMAVGPGPPDLLTLRAFRLLQQADVVLYEQSVSDEIMALIQAKVALIDVGKSQRSISQLLREYAQEGKRVALLKGGDSFIVNRGDEVIEVLREQKIPFQFVPGVMTDHACSEYAGIALKE